FASRFDFLNNVNPENLIRELTGNQSGNQARTQTRTQSARETGNTGPGGSTSSDVQSIWSQFGTSSRQ
ncbi:hypothetical protein, partial [Palleronia sp.]|uniref:hypothetical protein n=1 Tax=Palleronia sp. TaxID=1940284 RepID=UPI0035C799E1